MRTTRGNVGKVVESGRDATPRAFRAVPEAKIVLCPWRQVSRQAVPEKPCHDKSQSDHPDFTLNEKRKPEARGQSGPGDHRRVEALLVRQAQRGEIGDGIVDEHGEGAERPGDLDIADQRQSADGNAGGMACHEAENLAQRQQQARSRRNLARAKITGGADKSFRLIVDPDQCESRCNRDKFPRQLGASLCGTMVG